MESERRTKDDALVCYNVSSTIEQDHSSKAASKSPLDLAKEPLRRLSG